LRREGRYQEKGLVREPEEDEADQEGMRKKERKKVSGDEEGKKKRRGGRWSS
jgi:hypothetical protein